ncbi:MAG: MFS transporter [Mycobacteriaceae bacterium]|nr:MFS transporter [Mycobacteriaceae bacterium]MBV9638935.1 MFS transporter [Mycobacteriaceae bacterium]
MQPTAVHDATQAHADLSAARARIAAQLTVLSAAAFIYVTAEMVPVAALPAIATDLRVSEALVGTLLGTYALVAAVTTVPFVGLTARWPRRRTLLLTLVCLTGSQLISALAPNFAVLAAGRVLCAVTHGLMWSVIAPIGARLVPSTHVGRATTAVYLGTALALVVGSPLTAAMSQLWGWRLAVGVVTVVAASITAAAWLMLPGLSNEHIQTSPPPDRHYRNGRLVTLSMLTLVGVTGHFVSYTFIVVIIQGVVGVHGPKLAWLLAAYGIAGLVSMGLLARPLDRRPWVAVSGCLSALLAAFAVLTVLAVTRQPGMVAILVGSAAIVLWGAAVTALPPMLQSTVMRSAPNDPDGASGLYVAAFQVGIMAGSLGGGLLYARGSVPAILAASALLVTTALAGVLSNRGLFRLSAM